MKDFVSGFVLDNAAVVDRLIFGGLCAKDGKSTIVSRVKLKHVGERKVASRVAVDDEDGTRIAAANHIAKVVNTATGAKRFVLLQIANRYLELVLSVQNETVKLLEWLKKAHQIDLLHFIDLFPPNLIYSKSTI